jgi:hypothetical protein
MRFTDVADTQQLFRLIQSIPSPKAEPFKLWIAQVAKERLDQLQDPELSIEQAMTDYKRLGYSDNWINQRLKSIEIRKDLTDEWKRHGLQEGVQFAALTVSRTHRRSASRWKYRQRSPFEIGSGNGESRCNATKCQNQFANRSAEYEIVERLKII